MLFSVLVANYNNGRYFKDCYDSLLAQSYQSWELIVVDDCSTDNSLTLIRQLTEKDQRVKVYVNKKNAGCGFTKRRCAELANGDVCGFLDPDDTLMPDALQLMAKAHQSNSKVALVHSTFFFCDEYLGNAKVYTNASAVVVSEKFINLDGEVTAFSSYKNAFYKKTEGINPHLLRAVDQDLYLKLAETGAFFFLNKPLYNYRAHANGISTASTDKAFYWFLKVIAKTEERRKINLENEVGIFLNRTDPKNISINLANPRYLLLKMLESFRHKPSLFMRKLFVG